LPKNLGLRKQEISLPQWNNYNICFAFQLPIHTFFDYEINFFWIIFNDNAIFGYPKSKALIQKQKQISFSPKITSIYKYEIPLIVLLSHFEESPLSWITFSCLVINYRKGTIYETLNS
jgi:hypothetical protein